MKTKTQTDSKGSNRTEGLSKKGKLAASLEARKRTLQAKSILVPIDFSEPSVKALKYAAVFARKFGAKLTLLNVVEPAGTPDFMAAFPIMMENDRLAQMSEEQLRSVAGKYGIARGLVEKVLVRTGVAYHEIASAARTLKVDLIIIATHGNTGLKHFMLGSTTERVVRHAPCPVFVVRDGEREMVEGI